MKKIFGIFVCMLMSLSAVAVTAEQPEKSTMTPTTQLMTEVNISIANFSFIPSNVTIAVNTVVTWTNLALEPHDVVSDTGVFHSPILTTGQKFSFNFTTGGTYPYHCGIHPFMHGVIIVIGGGNLPPNKPTIGGSNSGKIGVVLNYTAATTDPEGDMIQYFFDWGDGTNTGWTPAVASGTISHQSHLWSTKGTYTLSVKARDTLHAESPTATLNVKMPVDISYSFSSGHMIFLWLYNVFLHFFPQFRELILV